LVKKGKKVVIVTSGAIGLGKRKIAFDSAKNASIKEQQGLAAIGQAALMREYAKRFESIGMECAQILLSQRDLMDKNCLANIRGTFEFLFEKNIVAVVNENDVVATDELRRNGAFSDNDALAALLAKQLGANLLIMLTSKNGLIGKDRTVLKTFSCIDELGIIKKNSKDGRGGIGSKLESIAKARTCGCDVFISGQDCFKGFSKGRASGTFSGRLR
jgi:glutamate 5-kinase